MNDVTIFDGQELNTLGKRVAYARQKRNLSQQELAKLLCEKREVISYIENDKPGRYLKSDDILKLAITLNVSADFLLGLANDISTDIDIKFISNYLGLTQESISEICKAKDNKDVLNFFFTETNFSELIDCLKRYRIICKCINEYLPILSLILDFSDYIKKCAEKNEINNVKKIFDECDKTFEILSNLIKYGNIYFDMELDFIKDGYFGVKTTVYREPSLEFIESRGGIIKYMEECLEHYTNGYESFSYVLNNYRKQLSFELSEHFDIYVKGFFKCKEKNHIKDYKHLIGNFIDEHNENMNYFDFK